MSVQDPTDSYEEFLDKVNEALTTEQPEAVLAEELGDRHPSEIGLALESLPPRDREQLWNLLAPPLQAQVLSHLHEAVRDSLIEGMESEALITIVDNMDVDDLADIIEILPKDVTTALFRGLDERHRRRLETTLSFEEGTAGRLMYTDVVSVRSDLTMDKALRYLRRRGLPSHTDGVMVTDRDGKYLGKLFFSALLGGDSGVKVAEVMDTEADWLTGKELSIGTLNGLLWALVVAVVAMLWFHDYRIGAVIAAAMVINLVAAALSGIAIPLMLKRVGIDPALSGAMILTTVTDVVGFMSFLGLGTLFLL